MAKKLKTPKIFEETDKFIEVEVPEGKREEYDLDGYELSGKGENFNGGFYEFFIKYKSEGGETSASPTSNEGI